MHKQNIKDKMLHARTRNTATRNKNYLRITMQPPFEIMSPCVLGLLLLHGDSLAPRLVGMWLRLRWGQGWGVGGRLLWPVSMVCMCVCTYMNVCVLIMQV